MTQAWIDERRKLLAAATPGPWWAEEMSAGVGRVYAVEIRGDGRHADCSPWTPESSKRRWSSRIIAKIQDWCEWTDHPSNRDLIIAARNDYAALLDIAEVAMRACEHLPYVPGLSELRAALERAR